MYSNPLVALQQFMSCSFSSIDFWIHKEDIRKKTKGSQENKKQQKIPLRKQTQSLEGTDYYDPEAPSRTCWLHKSSSC